MISSSVTQVFDEPSFEEPWHAQLFALTVSLNEQGHFSWSDWANAFGATLKEQGVSKDLNGGEDYFLAWLTALEGFLIERNLGDAETLKMLKKAWTQAYLTTPHGAPVSI